MFTPRREDGSVPLDVLAEHAQWLLSTGVDGLVVGGATGEYSFATESEFRSVVSAVAKEAGGQRFIAGIGGPEVHQCIRQGQFAAEAGARALLLATPHFFRYTQQDILAYVQAIASEVSAPILLYHLPQFSNGYATETSLQLISPKTQIAGIKDSSGSLDTLRALTQRGTASISRIVGNDSALVPARHEDLCDGVISGVAAALPELILYLFRTSLDADPDRYASASALLEEVILQLNRFPVPWGLKWIAEHRGLGPFGSPVPLSPERRAEAIEIGVWLEQFWQRASSSLPQGSFSVAGSIAGR
ncbi:MAG: dihydrodipicolinate synthase family protein [Bryobacterales bacterium]|nr:dihydrodipicolinate synthase family protein [Bryobacterales bacterium]